MKIYKIYSSKNTQLNYLTPEMKNLKRAISMSDNADESLGLNHPDQQYDSANTSINSTNL